MKTPPAILGKIAKSALKRVEKAKDALSYEQIKSKFLATNHTNHHEQKMTFHNALGSAGLSFICEVKKASPSKGIISEDFPWMEIAKEYEEAGAAAISVLTEPEFFMGSEQYLREISAAVKIPTLRKDFIVDPYQIYEAKLLGADAALLICALLEQRTLEEFLAAAGEIDLDCLVEIHSEDEAKEAIDAGAKIIGINNRDLSTFNVDKGLTLRLINRIPGGILTVAESGIETAADIRGIKDSGVNAVLIGESLMRSADRKRLLREMMAISIEETKLPVRK